MTMTKMVAGISKAAVEREAAMMDASSNFIWARKLRALRAALDKAEADNARLREALTFYADEENYRGYIHTDPCGCCSSWYEPKIHIDGEDSGNIARAAIAALNTGKADT